MMQFLVTTRSGCTVRIIKKVYQHLKLRSYINRLAEAEIMLDATCDHNVDFSGTEIFKTRHQKAAGYLDLYEKQLGNLQNNLEVIDRIKVDHRLSIDETVKNRILKSIIGNQKEESSNERVGRLKLKYQLFDWFGWVSAGKILRTAGMAVAFAMVLVVFFMSLANTQSSLQQSDFTLSEFNGASIQSSLRPAIRDIDTGDASFSFADLVFFKSDYSRSLTAEADEVAKTFLLKTKIPVRGAQFITLMPQSRIVVDYYDNKFHIKLSRGDVYYFGHKGIDTSFSKNDIFVDLVGTRVYFKNDDDGLNVKVTEGKVDVKQQGRSTRVNAGFAFETNGQAGIKPLGTADFKGIEQVHSKSLLRVKGAIDKSGRGDDLDIANALAMIKSTVVSDTPGKSGVERPSKNIQGGIKNTGSGARSILSVQERLKSSFHKHGNDKKMKVKIFMKTGSQITGNIIKLNKNELVLETVFGKYRASLDSITDFKRF